MLVVFYYFGQQFLAINPINHVIVIINVSYKVIVVFVVAVDPQVIGQLHVMVAANHVNRLQFLLKVAARFILLNKEGFIGDPDLLHRPSNSSLII